jgi:hypothetical protein
VLGSSQTRPWKLGKEEGLIFFILVSPLVSRIGNSYIYTISSSLSMLQGDVD